MRELIIVLFLAYVVKIIVSFIHLMSNELPWESEVKAQFGASRKVMIAFEKLGQSAHLKVVLKTEGKLTIKIANVLSSLIYLLLLFVLVKALSQNTHW